MDAALALGCRVMRVVCGDQYFWSPDPRAVVNTTSALTCIADSYRQGTRSVGLVVAVENHADAAAAELAQLVASITR